MTTVALFPSVLGIRQGVRDAAQRMRDAGHDVLVVDLYGAGRTFDDYDPALAHAEEELGHAELMRRAREAVADLPDGFVSAGFSLGCVMAVHLATQRTVSGVLMIAGALPASALGDGAWPAGVNAQTHSTLGDPWREQDMIDRTALEVAGAGATLEVFDYPGTGHLFTDPTLPAEYDPVSTELLWSRVLPFLSACG